MGRFFFLHCVLGLFYSHFAYSQNNSLKKDTFYIKVEYYSTGEVMAIDSFNGENRIGTTKTYYKNGNTKSIGYCMLLSREKRRVRTKDSVPYVEDVCTNCYDFQFDTSTSEKSSGVYSASWKVEFKSFIDEWYENGAYKVKHRTYYADGLLLMVESQYDSHGCINHIKLYQWLDNKYIREFGRIWSAWKLLN